MAERERVQRKTIGGDSLLQDHVVQLKCSNPAGTISKRAVQVLRDALRDSNTNPVRVIVEGEEDLLTLPILGTGSTWFSRSVRAAVQRDCHS